MEDDIIRKCEQLGEAEVRLRLARGAYGERKIPIVKHWLETQESRRRERTESLSIKQTRVNNVVAIASVIIAAIAIIWGVIIYLYPPRQTPEGTSSTAGDTSKTPMRP